MRKKMRTFCDIDDRLFSYYAFLAPKFKSAPDRGFFAIKLRPSLAESSNWQLMNSWKKTMHFFPSSFHSDS